MKTSFHTFNISDGTVDHGLIFEPDTPTKKAVAHVHGMGGNFYEAFFITPIAEALTAQGVAFAPFNGRGNGLVTTLIKEEEGTAKYYPGGNYRETFENCIDDIKAQINYIEAQGFEEIHLSGHSLGSPKVIYYMYKTQDPRVKSVMLLSPADMLGLEREDMEQFNRRITLAEQMIADGKGDSLMPENEWVWGEYPLTAHTYKNLFGDGEAVAVCNFKNLDDGFEALQSIKVPVLAVMGTKDDALVTPIEETMQLIHDNVGIPEKCETKIIDGARHDYYHHKAEVAEAVATWVAKQAT